MSKIIIVLSASLSLLAYMGYSWKNPPLNINPQITIIDCVKTKNTISQNLSSINNSFTINYLEHAPKECTNPYFPIIHIRADTDKQYKWLQIVFTDSKISKLQMFLDAAQSPEIYPFYTLDKDYYDAPHWSYTLTNKPLSYWKSHTYAIEHDKTNNTINCLGGISWGFSLSYFSLYPRMIKPSALSIKHWQQNWQFFKTYFPNYTNATTS